MSLVLADRVRQTTTSTGTGTITLDGSVDGFQSFAVIGNANTTYYTIAGGTQWEVGIGTYSSGTLARTTVISSSTGSKLDLAAGTKDVFVTLPAEKTVIGPDTATDNAITRYDSTTGKLIQNSNVTLADSGTAFVFSGAAGITASSGNVTLTPGTGGQTDLVKVRIAAQATGESVAVTGAANEWTSRVTGSSTSGQSYGTTILAGTNSSDKALQVSNQAGSADYFQIRGDGFILVGSANGRSGTFTLSGGTATVSNTSVTANSVILVTLKTLGGTRAGNPDIVPTASTGFVATGGGSDTSVYNYVILDKN